MRLANPSGLGINHGDKPYRDSVTRVAVSKLQWIGDQPYRDSVTRFAVSKLQWIGDQPYRDSVTRFAVSSPRQTKEGIIAPGRVVRLAGFPDLAGIAEFESEGGDGLSIGAMNTIAAHQVIRAAYNALAEAAGGLAKP